ncbi:MAG: hypothetical protein MJZ82_01115 [Paludibacteraceae bacterium]|nr:hypothetical protein [Paludibacteraceae bacterium]
MAEPRFILIAEEGERQLVERALPGLDWPVVVTGVGGVNIIRSLQQLPREATIINIGYAGSSNFEIGSWVEVTESRVNHPNCTYPEPVLPLTPLSEVLAEINYTDLLKDETMKTPIRAVDYTNSDFVLASDYRDCTFDMELAFIMAFGFKRVCSIKYVSDNLSLHAYHEMTQGVN